MKKEQTKARSGRTQPHTQSASRAYVCKWDQSTSCYLSMQLFYLTLFSPGPGRGRLVTPLQGGSTFTSSIVQHRSPVFPLLFSIMHAVYQSGSVSLFFSRSLLFRSPFPQFYSLYLFCRCSFLLLHLATRVSLFSIMPFIKVVTFSFGLLFFHFLYQRILLPLSCNTARKSFSFLWRFQHICASLRFLLPPIQLPRPH